MYIALLTLAFMAMMGGELPGLVKQKQYKALAIFLGLSGLGYGLSLLLMLGIKVPNPTNAIEFVVRTFTTIRFNP